MKIIVFFKEEGGVQIKSWGPIWIHFLLFRFVKKKGVCKLRVGANITPDRQQSKTLILSTNVDRKNH